MADSGKSETAYRTISEVADMLDLQQHVLRFWETKFNQIKPLKRGGNRRFYRPQDVELIQALKILLHRDGYTIRGVQKLFREQGVKQTIESTLQGEPAEKQPVIISPEKRISSTTAPRMSTTAQDPVTTLEAPIASNPIDQSIHKPVSGENSLSKLQSILSELKDIRDLLGDG